VRKRGLGAGRAVLAYAGLSVLSRHWHRNWGATPKEAVELLPGDQLVPRADLQTTRAITIDASPAEVWPWLVQMGQRRGGLYTYEWIENLLGAKIHNLGRIDPNLQRLEVGDRIRLTPDLYLGRIPGQFYRVTEIRPEHALVMLQELPTGALSSWSFTLRPSDATRTRLIVRARTSTPRSPATRIARQIELLVLEPGYFVMERGMLRGIRTRAEVASQPSDARSGDPTVVQISGEIVINRPAEEVFDFAADERNEPQYNPRMIRAEKTSPGPVGLGSQFQAQPRSLGRPVEMRIEYSAFDRPRRLASSTRLANMDIDGELTFDAVPDGTRLHWVWL
jgi:hypothetical protein